MRTRCSLSIAARETAKINTLAPIIITRAKHSHALSQRQSAVFTLSRSKRQEHAQNIGIGSLNIHFRKWPYHIICCIIFLLRLQNNGTITHTHTPYKHAPSFFFCYASNVECDDRLGKAHVQFRVFNVDCNDSTVVVVTDDEHSRTPCGPTLPFCRSFARNPFSCQPGAPILCHLRARNAQNAAANCLRSPCVGRHTHTRAQAAHTCGQYVCVSVRDPPPAHERKLVENVQCALVAEPNTCTTVYRQAVGRKPVNASGCRAPLRREL